MQKQLRRVESCGCIGLRLLDRGLMVEIGLRGLGDRLHRGASLIDLASFVGVGA